MQNGHGTFIWMQKGMVSKNTESTLGPVNEAQSTLVCKAHERSDVNDCFSTTEASVSMRMHGNANWSVCHNTIMFVLLQTFCDIDCGASPWSKSLFLQNHDFSLASSCSLNHAAWCKILLARKNLMHTCTHIEMRCTHAVCCTGLNSCDAQHMQIIKENFCLNGFIWVGKEVFFKLLQFCQNGDFTGKLGRDLARE